MHHSSSSSVVPEILDLLMRRYDIRKINQILCGAFFTSITSIRCTLSTLATTKGFEKRREYFCDEKIGVFSQESKKSNVQQQMLSDPSMLSEMLTKNLNMIVPNMITMAWVNFFFTVCSTLCRISHMSQAYISLQTSHITSSKPFFNMTF